MLANYVGGEDDRVTDDIDGVFDGLVTIKECSSED